MDAAVQERKKTLLASLLLSAWAPLATGIAAILGRSVTQLADFIRRTVEVFALLLSYLVFRNLHTRDDITRELRERWERIVNYAVAAALGVSGGVMLLTTIFYRQRSGSTGNVWLGLVIAILGLIVNLWFWRRYRLLGQEEPSVIIGAQRKLYFAKVLVDVCIVLALGAVALYPEHPLTAGIDSFGSGAVALYLLWSSLKQFRR